MNLLLQILYFPPKNRCKKLGYNWHHQTTADQDDEWSWPFSLQMLHLKLAKEASHTSDNTGRLFASTVSKYKEIKLKIVTGPDTNSYTSGSFMCELTRQDMAKPLHHISSSSHPFLLLTHSVYFSSCRFSVLPFYISLWAAVFRPQKCKTVWFVWQRSMQMIPSKTLVYCNPTADSADWSLFPHA